jgi:hypothetical protein
MAKSIINSFVAVSAPYFINSISKNPNIKLIVQDHGVLRSFAPRNYLPIEGFCATYSGGGGSSTGPKSATIFHQLLCKTSIQLSEDSMVWLCDVIIV